MPKSPVQKPVQQNLLTLDDKNTPHNSSVISISKKKFRMTIMFSEPLV